MSIIVYSKCFKLIKILEKKINLLLLCSIDIKHDNVRFVETYVLR